MKINCKCGCGCDYQASIYETVNKLDCNNSRREEDKRKEKEESKKRLDIMGSDYNY